MTEETQSMNFGKFRTCTIQSISKSLSKRLDSQIPLSSESFKNLLDMGGCSTIIVGPKSTARRKEPNEQRQKERSARFKAMAMAKCLCAGGDIDQNTGKCIKTPSYSTEKYKECRLDGAYRPYLDEAIKKGINLLPIKDETKVKALFEKKK